MDPVCPVKGVELIGIDIEHAPELYTLTDRTLVKGMMLIPLFRTAVLTLP